MHSVYHHTYNKICDVADWANCVFFKNLAVLLGFVKVINVDLFSSSVK